MLGIIIKAIIIGSMIFAFCYIRKRCVKNRPFHTLLQRRNAIRRTASTHEESTAYEDYTVPSASFRSTTPLDNLW